MSYIRQIGNKFTIEFWYQGYRYFRSLKVQDLKSAEKLQKKIDYEIAMGTIDPDFLKNLRKNDYSLSDFIKEYESFLECKKSDYSSKTIDDYIYSSRLLFKIVGDISLKKINTDLIEGKIKQFLNENYAYHSVRHFMGNFRSLFSKALEWKLLNENPFKGKVPRKKKRLPRYFKDYEIQKLDEYFTKNERPNWQGELVFFTMNTGLRKSEIINLIWDNVDLVHEQIIFTGKGDKERVVPLNKKAMLILNKRPRHIKNKKVFWEIKNRSAIDSAWRAMRGKTGIQGKFHDLRKTYACYYVMNGGSLERLREILGHEDYATVKIYETLSPDSLHKDKNIVNF